MTINTFNCYYPTEVGLRTVFRINYDLIGELYGA